MDFATTTLGLRFGATEKLNLTLSVPIHQISSSKMQGVFYDRTNNGIGDLVATVEYLLFDAPQLSVEVGVKFANGSTDRVDEFGQRICDILSLGSGTTDFLLGGSMWMPHVGGVQHLDVTAGLRHRFSGGQNKWGYQYGDQTTFRSHVSYPLLENTRFGLRFDGFHSVKDNWFGLELAERGATFLYASPTVSWNLREDMSVGGFVRIPVYMDLEGSQMVAPYTVGFEMTTDLSPVFSRVLAPLGFGE